RIRIAKSSNDQWEIGNPRSAGLVVANTTTLCRSSGGKSPRSTAARKVGQALETLGGEACPPLAHRARITTECLGNLIIGRPVRLTTVEDKAAAKGLSLGRRVGIGNLL